MNLFIKGIKDSEGKLQSAVADAFDFEPIISGGYGGYNDGGWNGNMNITINSALGQSAEQIATVVQKRILTEFAGRKQVWA